MNNEEFKVVELADGTKWFVLSEIVYDKGLYRYVVGVENDDLTDKFQVLRVYFSEGEEYFQTVKDQEILKQVIPLLMPDTKDYIDNPDKLKELMEQN